MEAKDTVMSNITKRQFRFINTSPVKDVSRWDVEGLLEAQAEISFKAGQDNGYLIGLKEGIEKGENVGRKAGIKEVVDMFQVATIVPMSLSNTIWFSMSYANYKRLFPDGKLLKE